MKWLKLFLLSSPLFICALGLFGLSGNASAASIQTSSFDLDYIPNPNASYRWVNGLLYGDSTSLQYARRYQFTTASLTPTGNYASLHFETNIVANASSQQYINFVNRDYISVLACSSSVSGSLQIQASSVSTAVTTWTDSQNRPSKTLTVYGDVALGGLSINQQQQIVCAVGSTSYAFFATNYTSASAHLYFEQNPMTILYTNNQSENLLQSQIYQNEQIINQNNTMINNQEQMIQQQEATNDWLTDNTAPSADTSSLGNAAGWLPPGPLDSILNLPIQFIQGIIGVFTNSNTCAPIVLPIGIVDYNLEIPCMRPFFELASVNIVWNTVGTIISAILIFNTLKWLYKFVDDTLSFRENNSTMWGGL